MAVLSPADAIVATLRASNIPKFDWTSGPWMDEAAEPQPGFPLCIFRCTPKPFGGDPAGDSIWTFEKTMQSGYDVEIEVHAMQPDIATVASEFGVPANSVFAYLDTFIDKPGSMTQDATVFSVNKWLRQAPVDYKISEYRSPDTPRVYKASAMYTMCVLADHN